MSGASMATGPRTKKSAEGTTKQDMKDRMHENEGAIGGVMGSLRVVELQLVAFIIVFSASGLVPIQDLVFPVFLSIYAFLLSGMVFPSYGASKPPEVFRGNRVFQLYVVFGTTIGLFLPLAYILGGFARGDQGAVRDAAPHLFLLSFQILSENVISGLGIFSMPVRSLLPILYTTRRLFALADWTVNTWTRTAPPTRAETHMTPMISEETWTWFGRSLSVANSVYYGINLFCFLIPMFLPRAFESYFNDRAVHLSQKREEKGQHGEHKHKEEQGKKQGHEPGKKVQ